MDRPPHQPTIIDPPDPDLMLDDIEREVKSVIQRMAEYGNVSRPVTLPDMIIVTSDELAEELYKFAHHVIQDINSHLSTPQPSTESKD